ncbi:acylneuraminate cytidylyltransferase family protein [Bdellovibrio svalbardensis]|uniref:Acylneuraminate cytidylyltransferase family protein n=1 Tax=Bdellovibrio svalbardensis TaxID=2972972 RepID=A0ABT6DKF6_9BACT|nr:acylneuraminate cytidylyltransferase family protein [Bdellovibrio svalbardensis]MDG0817349.1 acylneuraminate cytidylyltransferase family protein [Bdellovibrio svalbardensis]
MRMFKGKSFLAIIPARGGSKRLPGKNVRLLAGKPLVNWSVEAALSSKYVDEVLVSTDSTEVVEAARAVGVSVPFVRPVELSSDTASSSDVIQHALDFYRNEQGKIFDYVILLQPTSPLRTAEDIDSAIELLSQKKADAVISVCPMEHSPLWSNILPEDLSLGNFLRSEVQGVRSQDLPTYYRINGAIYICDMKRFTSEKTLFLKENIFAFVMSSEKSVDIDTLTDFALAEVLISKSRTE